MELVIEKVTSSQGGVILPTSAGYDREGWRFQGSVSEPAFLDFSKLLAVTTTGNCTREEFITHLSKRGDFTSKYSILGVRAWTLLKTASYRFLLKDFSQQDTARCFLFGAAVLHQAEQRTSLLAHSIRYRPEKGWSFDSQPQAAQSWMLKNDYVLCVAK